MYVRRRLQDEAALEFAGCGGFKHGKRFLAFVDLQGTTYAVSTRATGYGAHIVQPLLRRTFDGRKETLEEDEARQIIEQSMQVLFYRDARSIDQYNITAAGLHISESRKLETLWGFAVGIWGTGADTVVKIQAFSIWWHVDGTSSDEGPAPGVGHAKCPNLTEVGSKV
ncbi:hypothetical protein B0H16DRAFT_1481647 [Mycena metata]|uniref:Uncharacterized protein n=1 Tax=Mycena metata TaxID=1033252 RepID=A0AAD7M9R9_9AGAR|nr:hypothetical protein B0H16DRAFT_1481647 [Mycena metata]